MENLKPKDPIPRRFHKWYRQDREHSSQWRREAKEDFDFVAGRQWSEQEKNILLDQLRPVMSFNYVGAYMDSVQGHEIGNRQEIRYIPREMGDIRPNEILTAGAEWFRDQSDMEGVESECFLDAVIGGVGCSEERVDAEENPAGDPYSERMDPLEMVWDCNARKPNLTDANRAWRVREVPIEEAREMFTDFSDGELDAAWASFEGVFSEPSEHDGFTRLGGGDMATEEKDTVTIVQCQYREKQTFYKAVNPLTQEEVELDQRQYDLMQKMGLATYAVRFSRKVVRQAFLGNVVLSYGDAPSPEQFSWSFVTGKRDRVKKTWYGVVRAMKDPQRWSNKWRSQLLHIINSNAKGGIMAERSAFEDSREAEQTYARPDSITWMQEGSLSGQTGPKIQPKPQSQFPAGFQYLTESAEDAIRKVSNINLEMLGMRESDQPGVLEYQRREAGMTALQPLFDQLRLYRKRKGKLLLYYIQNYLSDNRLIRIVGEQGEQYVPLARQASAEFDIICDDAPTAPNQKERAWGAIQALMPSIRDMVTPEVLLKVLEYSPLPSSLVDDLRQMAERGQAQGAEQQQVMQQMQQRMIAAQVAETESDARKNMTAAQQDMADVEFTRAKTQRELIEAQRLAAAPPEPQQFTAP